jgi:hypothetical protein
MIGLKEHVYWLSWGILIIGKGMVLVVLLTIVSYRLDTERGQVKWPPPPPHHRQQLQQQPSPHGSPVASAAAIPPPPPPPPPPRTL